MSNKILTGNDLNSLSWGHKTYLERKCMFLYFEICIVIRYYGLKEDLGCYLSFPNICTSYQTSTKNLKFLYLLLRRKEALYLHAI